MPNCCCCCFSTLPVYFAFLMRTDTWRSPRPSQYSPSAALQWHLGRCSHQTFGAQELGGCLGVPWGSLPSSTSSSPTPPAVPPRPGRPRARHSCVSAARWAARRQGLEMSRDDAPSAGRGLGVVSRGIRSWCGNVSVHPPSAAPLALLPVPSRGQPRGAGRWSSLCPAVTPVPPGAHAED